MDRRFDPAQAEFFLDQLAEIFDNGMAIGPSTPMLDPIDNQPITAQQFLERIRLGK